MNILVAVDFSDVSRGIVDLVRRLPQADRGKVFLLHVTEPDPEFVGWEAGPGVVRDQMAAHFQHQRREIESMAADLREAGRDVTAMVIQGPTVATILDEIERRGAGLVVVGSHGHGAAYDLLVGSISSGVIRKSPVPVLVVPHR